MTSILEKLFWATRPTMQSEAERQAMAAVERLVQPRLTEAQLDRLWAIVTEMELTDCLSSFTCGYRLGVQLTAAGLSRAAAPAVPPGSLR